MDPASDLESVLSDIETRLERLRALYEQYFQGMERLEPSIARRDVERRMEGLRKQRSPSTALRFRTQMLFQRYTTLSSYWMRVCRQIEEGTYIRDLKRARRRSHVATPIPPREEPPLAQASEAAMASRPEEVKAPVLSKRPPPVPVPAPLPVDRAAELCQAYFETRRRHDKALDPSNRDAVIRSIRDMLSKLEQKHQGKSVDLEIVVQDGRVGFKPVVRSGSDPK